MQPTRCISIFPEIFQTYKIPKLSYVLFDFNQSFTVLFVVFTLFILINMKSTWSWPSNAHIQCTSTYSQAITKWTERPKTLFIAYIADIICTTVHSWRGHGNEYTCNSIVRLDILLCLLLLCSS